MVYIKKFWFGEPEFRQRDKKRTLLMTRIGMKPTKLGWANSQCSEQYIFHARFVPDEITLEKEQPWQ